MKVKSLKWLNRLNKKSWLKRLLWKSRFRLLSLNKMQRKWLMLSLNQRVRWRLSNLREFRLRSLKCHRQRMRLKASVNLVSWRSISLKSFEPTLSRTLHNFWRLRLWMLRLLRSTHWCSLWLALNGSHLLLIKIKCRSSWLLTAQSTSHLTILAPIHFLSTLYNHSSSFQRCLASQLKRQRLARRYRFKARSKTKKPLKVWNNKQIVSKQEQTW